VTGKQAKSERAKFVITSYDLLVRHDHLQKRYDQRAFQAIIVDESHYIKDARSKRSSIVLQLCSRAKRCVLISGTPAVNRAAELHTQFQILLPTPPSHTLFCERYCELEEKHLRKGPKVVQWTGAKRKSELHALLTGTFMIRRLKKDVLHQLPIKRRQRITLDSTKLDAAIMKEVQDCLNAEASMEEEGEPREIMQAFRRTAEAKIHGVAAYVEYLIQSDIKFLLFAHHHVMLDALENKLRELSTSYIRIDGTTPQKKRHSLVDTFQCEPSVKVALLSITACGQGLTLTAASTVVFAELYWVVGQMLQAEDRAHRIGQVQMVDVQYCIAEGSVDELVYKSLNRKSRDTTGMLDGEEKCLGAWKRTDAPSLENLRLSLSIGDDKFDKSNHKKRSGQREGIEKYFKRSFCDTTG